MNILWHTWEPGLSGNGLTSGGGGAWTRFLFNEFNKAGHQVYWFTHDAPDLDESWEPALKIDVAVMCWRWLLPNEQRYEERNRAYRRQMKLIQWCIEHDVPFLIHDQDLKMSDDEESYVIYEHGLIAEPSFYPPGHRISLHFPNPYRSIEKNVGERESLIYIGNNYERFDQVYKYLAPFSIHHKTILYGNWMESSSTRSTPGEIKRYLPYVEFPGRLSQEKVIETLSGAKATVLFHKPDYGPRGFVTIRWAEAAAADIVPFIPTEFKLPDPFRVLLEPIRVSDGNDLIEKFNKMDEVLRIEMTERFRGIVHQIMTSENWIRTLERMKK